MTEGKVQWLEWGADAFARARAEDKPVLLSIGATWCYWCHVMERTSYSDDECAALIRDHFIPIYVDNDRRPDINDRYNMGGWPTTAFLTPRAEIIAGATYLPPEELRRILAQVGEAYKSKRDQILEQIKEREAKIAQVQVENYPPQTTITHQILQHTLRGIAGTYDAMYGGFGRAPKFPMAASVQMLEHVYAETGGQDFREMLVKTLDVMGDRGMYDQAEGGFFRYSTNDTWTTPHFEKMIEDQAGLIKAYVMGGQMFEQPKYTKKAEHAIAWALAKLCDRERGVFFGSIEANEEYYGAEPEKRPAMTAPAMDKTVYVNWSAQMASTLLYAAAAMGKPEWGDLARRGLNWIWLNGWDTEKGVCHYFDFDGGPQAAGGGPQAAGGGPQAAGGGPHAAGGGPKAHGLCRDAAWLATALLDAHEWSGDPEDLKRAEQTLEFCMAHFWQPRETELRDRRVVADDVGELTKPIKNLVEGATVASALLRLAAHRDKPRLRAKAWEILMSFPNYGMDYGHQAAEFALAADRFACGDKEIVLLYREVGATRKLIDAAAGSPMPRRVVHHLMIGRDDAEIRARSLNTSHSPAAFVMKSGKPLAPAMTPADLAERLKE